MIPKKLPSTWKTQRVADLIARFDAGVSVNGGDRPAMENECGVLKISAVTEGMFRPEENKVIDGIERDRANLNPKRGRLIMSRANTPELVGANAYIHSDHPNLFLSDKLWQFEPRDETEFSMRWLGFLLSSPAYRKRMGEVATGSSQSMKNISQENVLQMVLPVPPLDEQCRIAQLLGAWESAIEKTELLIAAKEKLKSGLMSRLLTGKQRLNGFNASWRYAYLGELFRERVEVNWNDLQLLSITGENGVVPRSELNRKDSSNDDKSKYQRICPGDIGYNTMRMWQGVSALSSYEGIISPAYTVCTPSPEIDGTFASYLFKLPEVIHLFYRYSQGLTSDTWNLKFHHFAEVRVYIPELDEQIAIASVLSGLDKELAIRKQQRNALGQQKRGLMQKLLTGQWQVPVTSKEAVA